MNESICWWALRGSQGCHYSAFFSPFAYPETDGIRSLPNWRLGNTSSPVLIWRLLFFSFYICVFSILDLGRRGCSKFGHWVLLKLIGFFRDFFPVRSQFGHWVLLILVGAFNLLSAYWKSHLNWVLPAWSGFIDWFCQRGNSILFNLG